LENIGLMKWFLSFLNGEIDLYLNLIIFLIFVITIAYQKLKGINKKRYLIIEIITIIFLGIIGTVYRLRTAFEMIPGRRAKKRIY